MGGGEVRIGLPHREPVEHMGLRLDSQKPRAVPWSRHNERSGPAEKPPDRTFVRDWAFYSAG